jgi:predicted methyltransferase
LDASGWDNTTSGHRRRLAIFLVSAIFIFVTMYVLYSGISTLQRLEVVESARDQWQRPLDVLRALDLREGDTVVDLGSGAGYFALKLSAAVGMRGQVLAVDVRKLSLFFLWMRVRLRSRHNVQIVAGEPDDPRLPTGTVDAVLICNAYHEFSDPELMLNRIFQALRPGGKLVVVDRAPLASAAKPTHEVPLIVVDGELRRDGFEIVNQDNHFITRPGDDLWWLVTGRKP